MHHFVFRLLLFGLFITGNLISAYGQEEGLASYYHNRFHGRKAASGYIHDNDDYVAAHRTLPFGTFVHVTNLKNMKSVIVSIMDRGPRRKNRIIDVSQSAAEALDFIKAGVTRVRIEVVPGPVDLRYLDLMRPSIPFLPIEQQKETPPFIYPKE